MDREERNEKSKGYLGLKGTLHMGIATLYIALGFWTLYTKMFITFPLSTAMAYVAGCLLVAYGGFRFWRGLLMVRNKG